MGKFKKSNSNGKGLSHPAVKVLALLNMVVLGVGLYIYFRDQTPDHTQLPIAEQDSPYPNSRHSDTVIVIPPEEKSKPEPTLSSTSVSVNAPSAENNSIATRGKQLSPLVIRATNNSPAIRYTVAKGQAHFHNRPDPSTRRKAFINHWNKAVLQPLDQQNGFVYIVYTNHLGQTSRGWLKIQDLQALPGK